MKLPNTVWKTVSVQCFCAYNKKYCLKQKKSSSLTPQIVNTIFFGSFAKQLRKMSIIPVMFVYPPICGMKQRHSHRSYCHENSYLGLLLKSIDKFRFWLKSDTNTLYIKMYIYLRYNLFLVKTDGILCEVRAAA